MRRETFKLLVLAAIVAFAVLYGMELSSKGIESVNGKYQSVGDSSTGDPEATDEWTLPSNERSVKQPTASKRQSSNTDGLSDLNDFDEELYGIPRNDHKPLVDRVSGATAGVLHDLSKGGIKFVVSIFNKATGS
ncbi:hypothetical protein [Cohnella yongneupensis]|uniref:Uncharacterized protein n=1 Tax=Cohnella yongneupensis TaxID=425006 RepID=A0ABW0R4H7_9BACL